ncbi:AAA family ATPase [Flavobacterium sp. KBS0721]|uniref:AAA family ATPase n=1 Tax=Flavobacterium sp. KBS0721 TaxID=1179672 RepID=UPI00098FF150|nr:AAA family ATPase [Flavobacterium sp. KBS0721]QDW20675.1 hypothetical protein B0M43_0011340 [Flavobacterium sp. KBS0721]
MDGFKLIAIRPLVGCDKKFLKNLQVGCIYQFYNEYQFYDINKFEINDLNSIELINEKAISTDVYNIIYNSQIPHDLYSIESVSKNIINVSAIVGKNGSGKSTIVELFNLFIFCLSNRLDLINVDIFKRDHSLNDEDQKRLKEELNSFDLFNCEMYYLIENVIYCIVKKGKSFYQMFFEANDNSFDNIFSLNEKKTVEISLDFPKKNKIDFLRNTFFYSISANYSLYGLNTNETGIWLKSIFHKNDGYQAPIVIDPMRTKGKIDINSLTYLSKSRLLSNIFRKLEPNQKIENSLRNLVNNKIVQNIDIKLDLNKFRVIDNNSINNYDQNFIIKIDDKNIYLRYTFKYNNRFDTIIKTFNPDFKGKENEGILDKLTREYILKKTFTVLKKYPEYEIFSKNVFKEVLKDENVKYEKHVFEKLALEDFSHSTFKLRQAINFYVYDFYKLNDQTNKSYVISTSKDDGISDIINNMIEEIKSEKIIELQRDGGAEIDLESSFELVHNKYNLVYYIPPSFFEVDIQFQEKGSFNSLSSGEKQMIFSISSIIYHLTNLKSIDSEERISYKYFNIILDEIELYFHPEFQRKYIYELLRSIKSMNFHLYGINIMFLTHSPFILSDIPNQNILRLIDGFQDQYDENGKTFGANIHELLANDFYLAEGFMGEFAKEKILDLILYLKFDEEDSNSIKSKLSWSEASAKGIIDIVGEPIIKERLESLFEKKFYKNDKDYYLNKIKEYELKLKKIDYEKNSN